MTLNNRQRNLTMDDVVKTRSGKIARIISTDRVGSGSVVALVSYNGRVVKENLHIYYPNGDYLLEGIESPLDLVIQYEQEKDIVELVMSSSLATLYALNDANAAIILQAFNLTSLTSDRDKLASALEKSLTDRTRI